MVVIGFCFIFIHIMKIYSAAVCGFLFRDPVGHAQDMLFLTPVCLQQYCDGGSNPDELDGKLV